MTLVTDPSRFEALPKEIRLEIFEYLLIHDGDIIPFPTQEDQEDILWDYANKAATKPVEQKALLEESEQDAVSFKGEDGLTLPLFHPTRQQPSLGSRHYRPDLPCIALLGVNRNVRESASNFVFARNVWRLTYHIWNSPWEPWSGEFWLKHDKDVKRLSVHFSWRDLPPRSLELWRSRFTRRTRGPGPRFGDLHSKTVQRINDIWNSKRQLVMETTSLRSLRINLESAWCPMLCCNRHRAIVEISDMVRWLAFKTLHLGHWDHIELRRGTESELPDWSSIGSNDTTVGEDDTDSDSDNDYPQGDPKDSADREPKLWNLWCRSNADFEVTVEGFVSIAEAVQGFRAMQLDWSSERMVFESSIPEHIKSEMLRGQSVHANRFPNHPLGPEAEPRDIDARYFDLYSEGSSSGGA